MSPLSRRQFLSASMMAAASATLLPHPTEAAYAAGTSEAIIAASLQPFVDQRQISGGVGLVAFKNRVHIAAVGLSDLQAGRAMKVDDLFWIASMTKPIAGSAILQLRDEGRLSLEDPVEKHLPEFKGQWLARERSEEKQLLVRPARVITIRDLLTHTSGMGDAPSPRFDASLAEVVAGYARVPLSFEPGSRWSYSNPGINTLGRIVEVASGMPVAEYLEKRFFKPLGMRDTTFWPTASQVKRLAKSYKTNAEGQLTETTLFFMNGALSDRRRTPLPAGGLFSTARDMGRFYSMLLAGGRWNDKAFISPDSLKLATTTQTGTLPTGFVEGMSWGLGFQVVRTPMGVTSMLSPGTFGHGGAYATQSWADPARGMAMVLMIQRAGLANGDASDMRRAFQTAATGLAG